MANVNIKFNNKDYLLSCDDGQEENLKKLADHLDSKYNELKNAKAFILPGVGAFSQAVNNLKKLISLKKVTLYTKP